MLSRFSEKPRTFLESVSKGVFFHKKTLRLPKHKHRFTAIAIFPNSYLIFQFIIINNGTNKNQLENLSKDELIDEVLSLENFKNDINAKFSELNDCFNDFQTKYEMVNSNLSISRHCSELLLGHITQIRMQ